MMLTTELTLGRTFGNTAFLIGLHVLVFLLLFTFRECPSAEVLIADVPEPNFD